MFLQYVCDESQSTQEMMHSALLHWGPDLEAFRISCLRCELKSECNLDLRQQNVIDELAVMRVLSVRFFETVFPKQIKQLAPTLEVLQIWGTGNIATVNETHHNNGSVYQISHGFASNMAILPESHAISNTYNNNLPFVMRYL